MAAVPRVLLLPIGTPETTCFVRVAKDDNSSISGPATSRLTLCDGPFLEVSATEDLSQ